MKDKTFLYVYYDIMQNVLQMADNPGQLAEYLTHQIRELIGTKTVVIAIQKENGEPEIYSVFPKRRTEIIKTSSFLKLCELSFQFTSIKYLSDQTNKPEITHLFKDFEIKNAITIPINTSQKTIGSIILLEVMDLSGIESVINLLEKLSAVFGLIIRNSYLFHNLETEVDHRTVELKQRNIQLQEAKEKAEENEEKYRLLHENAGLGIGYYDRDGFVLSYNSVAANHMNGNPVDFIGKSVFQLFPKKEAERYYTRIQKAITSEKSINYEDRVILPTTEKWFLSTFTTIKNRKSEVLGVQIISQDITEMKQSEIALMKALEKAEESERLKTSFLQNMSHEIRTPLNAICGFSDALAFKDITEDDRKNYIKVIQNSSNQLLAIVNDILTMSAVQTNQEKVHIMPVNINSIIIELLTTFKAQATNKNILLIAKRALSDEKSEILTDKTKLTQILSNLMTNALKFTHQGSIEFGYQVLILAEPVLEFFVKDTGIGIKHEHQTKIFDRFIQADQSIQSSYGGTGLGLAISKAFTNLLGGEMRLESEPGKGSAFYFTLPFKTVNGSLP